MRVALLAGALVCALGSASARAGDDAWLDLSEQTLNAMVARIGALSDAGFLNTVCPVFQEFTECHVVGHLSCPGPDRPPLPGVNLERIPLMRCSEPVRIGLPPRAIITVGTPRVPWQWWITDAAFDIKPGGMKFKATVRSMIGRRLQPAVEREVDASVRFDDTAGELKIEIGEFAVALEHPGECGLDLTAAYVDVAHLHGLSIPLDPMALDVPMLAGTPKRITGSIVEATTQLSNGRLRVRFDVDFE